MNEITLDEQIAWIKKEMEDYLYFSSPEEYEYCNAILQSLNCYCALLSNKNLQK